MDVIIIVAFIAELIVSHTDIYQAVAPLCCYAKLGRKKACNVSTKVYLGPMRMNRKTARVFPRM